MLHNENRKVGEPESKVMFELHPCRNPLFDEQKRVNDDPLGFRLSINAAYPEAFNASQEENVLPKDCRLRRVKYLTNVIEQDHRFIKKKVQASQCFKRFHTAEQTLEGIEAMDMMRKGQVKRLAGSDVQGQVKFVVALFQYD